VACVRYLLLMLPLAALAAAEPAAVDTTGSGDELFGFGRSIVTLIGLGGALILLAILFMLRKFLGFVMNAVFMTLGAVLVVPALVWSTAVRGVGFSPRSASVPH
jgi:hypothetical protein